MGKEFGKRIWDCGIRDLGFGIWDLGFWDPGSRHFGSGIWVDGIWDSGPISGPIIAEMLIKCI